MARFRVAGSRGVANQASAVTGDVDVTRQDVTTRQRLGHCSTVTVVWPGCRCLSPPLPVSTSAETAL